MFPPPFIFWFERSIDNTINIFLSGDHCESIFSAMVVAIPLSPDYL